MRLPTSLAALAASTTAVFLGLAGTSAQAGADSGCGAGTYGNTGYAYAGHASDRKAHGVRATIQALAMPTVAAGHVAGWVGVGGPGAGPKGEDVWLQVGLAAWPGSQTILYVEFARPGITPVLRPIETGVPVDDRRRVAVLEMNGRPGWWRAYVGGKPVIEPIHLPGSSGRWQPIATGESWNGDVGACNRFSFRFEDVKVAGSPGGSWRPFLPGYKFQDKGFAVLRLSPLPGRSRSPRMLTAVEIEPYAFIAHSLAAPPVQAPQPEAAPLASS